VRAAGGICRELGFLRAAKPTRTGLGAYFPVLSCPGRKQNHTHVRSDRVGLFVFVPQTDDQSFFQSV
jgi:hypothetical protein